MLYFTEFGEIFLTNHCRHSTCQSKFTKRREEKSNISKSVALDWTMVASFSFVEGDTNLNLFSLRHLLHFLYPL